MQNYQSAKTFKRLTLVGLVFAGLLMWQCNGGKPQNTEAVRKEMAERELKRISDADLMAKGEEIGRVLLDSVQLNFQQALMKALKEKGVSGAIEYCNLNVYGLVKAYEDSLSVVIRRTTDRPRNPANALDSLERQIFEAYTLVPDAGAQLQVLDEKTLIMTRPIRIANGTCLNCHGEPGKQIQSADHELIRSLYPEDRATGYQLNDLRGMWSLRIPKKAVVDRI